MTEENLSQPVRFIVLKKSRLEPALEILRAVLRWSYTVAVFGGCAYLVFARGESGWLFVPACFLMVFRRGL